MWCLCGCLVLLTRGALTAKCVNVCSHAWPIKTLLHDAVHLTKANMTTKPACMHFKHYQSLEIRVTRRYYRRIVISDKFADNVVA